MILWFVFCVLLQHSLPGMSSDTSRKLPLEVGENGASSSHDGLLLELDHLDLLASGHHVLVLDAHNTATPLASKLLVFIVVLAEGGLESGKVSEVFLPHFGESEASSSLHVNEFTEVGLSADEAVRDTGLAAKSREEDNHLNGVNIVSNHNEGSTLLLNKLGNVVQSELDVDGLVGLGSRLVSGNSGETFLLGLTGLRAIFGKQFKELSGLVTLKSTVELCDGWRNLQALEQDALLTLNTDVLGPSNEAGQISLRLDVSTDSKVAWVLFEQRVFISGGGLACNEYFPFRWGSWHNQ